MENVSPTDWQAVIAFAYVVYGLVGGVATVPLVKRIKGWLNIKGRLVQVLTVLVAVAVAGIGLLAGGLISPEPLSFAHVVELLTLLLLASQAEYSRIKRQA